jgi:outer membrane protein assembly factor BamB
MKRSVVFILLVLSIGINAQSVIEPHPVDLFLRVADYAENIIPFKYIYLKEPTGKTTKKSMTDAKGIAQFTVTSGKSYQIFLTDTTPFTTISIPERSLSFSSQQINIPPLTDAEKAAQIRPDTIDQTTLGLQRPDPGNIFFKIGLKDHMNRPVRNFIVRVIDPKTMQVYISKTNTDGFAQFHVAGKTKYIIGINDFEQYDTVTVPGYSYGLILTYVPTKVFEDIKGDTVFQQPSSGMSTTSERALVKIILRDHDNKWLPNEPVFFDVIGKNKVYAGKTDKNGTLIMLLPKGDQYELNFKYERAMQRLDYPMSPILYSTQLVITTIGAKRVEEYYKTAQRTGEFRTEFMQPTISPVRMESNIVEKTPQGFNMNFAEKGPVVTPAVYNKKLYVSSGSFSPEIYCVDANTGAFNWGIQLAESGPSVMVVEDGILLINTESCTLYAIDAETGVLAWSKWLGPYIYHSPTVNNGKVYASYPDDIYVNRTENFVLASFDLKTGEIVWQSRMYNEPLGAPVAYGNHIFVTDAGGLLYSFDATTGKRTGMVNIGASNPPVFDGTNLWVNFGNRSLHSVSHLGKFSPDNLTLLKEYSSLYDSVTRALDLTWMQRMSYSRSRVLISEGQYFQYNCYGLQSFNPNDGTLRWSIPIKPGIENQPSLTLAGKNLVVNVNNTKLAFVEPTKGTFIKEINVGHVPSSEPVIANGWIYTGTKSGKMVAIKTADKLLDGWGQWGMNGSHNTMK